MIPAKVRFAPVSTEAIQLKSGLNENSSSMELKGGDIIDGYNYYIKEGTFGGYTSTAGYERYDGRPSPSSFGFSVLAVELTGTVTPGDTVVGGSGSATVAGYSDGDLILIDVTGEFHTGNLYVAPLTEMLDLLEMDDDTELMGDAVGTCTGPQVLAAYIPGYKRIAYAAIIADYVRDSIEEVPGSGVVRGLHVHDGVLYAFRDKVGGLEGGMYKATEDGWEEVTTVGITFEPGGVYKFLSHNFYAGSDTYYMYWINSVDHAHYFDGTDIIPIVNAGMGADDKPTSLSAHNDRLFLAYPGGSLQYSVAGDPTDFTDGAGEIGIGEDITEISPSLGNTLIIFCRNQTKIINGYISNDPASDWTLETFSKEVGATSRTVREILGTLVFMDEKGVTTLQSAQEFGNFQANSISQRVFKTIDRYRRLVTCSSVHRDFNQYRLFFNNKYALYFTFSGKNLKGATLMKFPIPIYYVAEGEDANGSFVSYCSTATGMVYKMDTGTSFDGTNIQTKMQTAFYHYGSPRRWKRFKRTTFELSSASEVNLLYRFLFDYASETVPKSVPYEVDTFAADDRYGEGEWGAAIYSSGSGTSRVGFGIKGVGSNMSIVLSTDSNQAKQHTFQTFVTDYQISGRQL